MVGEHERELKCVSHSSLATNERYDGWTAERVNGRRKREKKSVNQHQINIFKHQPHQQRNNFICFDVFSFLNWVQKREKKERYGLRSFGIYGSSVQCLHIYTRVPYIPKSLFLLLILFLRVKIDSHGPSSTTNKTEMFSGALWVTTKANRDLYQDTEKNQKTFVHFANKEKWNFSTDEPL